MIDAHLHVFRSRADDPQRSVDELAPAQREAPVETFWEIATGCGIDRAVLVPLGIEDDYVTTIVRSDPDRYRMIAVDDPAIESVSLLERRLDHSGAHGLRWFGLPAVDHGTRGAETLDLLERSGRKLWLYLGPDDEERLGEVAARHPDLMIVLNHSALPSGTMTVDRYGRPRLSASLAGRAERLATVCDRPNVWTIISGQYAFSNDDYPYLDIARYLNDLTGSVGTERLIWGSDYPWIVDHPGYRESVDLPRLQLDAASDDDIDAIMGGNAARLFGFAHR